MAVARVSLTEPSSKRAASNLPILNRETTALGKPASSLQTHEPIDPHDASLSLIVYPSETLIGIIVYFFVYSTVFSCT